MSDHVIRARIPSTQLVLEPSDRRLSLGELKEVLSRRFLRLSGPHFLLKGHSQSGSEFPLVFPLGRHFRRENQGSSPAVPKDRNETVFETINMAVLSSEK